MITSPEAAKMVLVSRAHLFKPTYPKSKERMIGPEAIFFHQGDYHSRLKKLVQASLLPSAIKGSVSEIEQIVLKQLPTWKNSTINTLQQMKRVHLSVCWIFFGFFSAGLWYFRKESKSLFLFFVGLIWSASMLLMWQ